MTPLLRTGLVVALVAALGTIAVLHREVRGQSAPSHKLVLHITENDPAKMTMVLNNMTNAAGIWNKRGEPYEIEVVAIGPGLHMLREDTSPVKERVKTMAETIPHLTFSTCENTRAGMRKAEGKEIPLVAQAHPVPAGIVRIEELEEQGYHYVRP